MKPLAQPQQHAKPQQHYHAQLTSTSTSTRPLNYRQCPPKGSQHNLRVVPPAFHRGKGKGCSTTKPVRGETALSIQLRPSRWALLTFLLLYSLERQPTRLRLTASNLQLF